MIDPVFNPHPARLFPLACVSRAPHGEPADDEVSGATLSADGRVAAFSTRAANLIHGLRPDVPQVYVRDLESGAVDCVSVSSDGHSARGPAFDPALSADGRFVAFASPAANLVAGDRNSWCDVFVRDRATGATERVSVATSGAEGDGESIHPAISGDGRYVAFASMAPHLAEGAGPWPSAPAGAASEQVPPRGASRVSAARDPASPQIYVRDRVTRRTLWIAQGDTPSLSADGSRVAFASGGQVCVRDVAGGAVTRLGPGESPALSADGRRVAWVSNGGIRVCDLDSGTALDLPGPAVTPTLSADGRRVAFVASPGRASVVEVADPDGGSPIAITAAWDPRERGGMDHPVLSADGTRVVFTSDAPGLSSGPAQRQAYVALLDTSPAPAAPPPQVTREGGTINLGGVRVPVRR